jgi:hypothetical protein
MQHLVKYRLRRLLGLLLSGPLAVAACDGPGDEPQAERDVSSLNLAGDFPNPNGTHATVSTKGTIDQTNPFFQSLGTNGRACVTCHDAADAWSITPAHLQQRFDATGGLDPIFRLNDGANAPNLPVSTMAERRAAYSMLLNRGLIRVGLPIPANAEFDLILVEDPYHFASAQELSLFRRPLPSTNLKFLSGVMWDGRESVPGATLVDNLSRQANDATLGHAQAATPPTSAQRAAIVDFEMALFTAQSSDSVAGSLSASPARGGPLALSRQVFFIGINDPLGGNPTGAPFTSKVFDLYDGWASQSGSAAVAQRASIARGQSIFNTRPIRIQGVRGVNDVLGVATLNGTCTTCHDSPNVGNHSVALPLDLGLTDPNTYNTDVMPRYTLRNKTTGATIRTSDPGRAMITGKWAQIGLFKGPILHGLAARPPYFHNGFALTLADVVKFYDTRFHIGFDAQAAADLVAFLETL